MFFFSDLRAGRIRRAKRRGRVRDLWGNGFGATPVARRPSRSAVARSTDYPIWTTPRSPSSWEQARATGDIVVHVAGKGDSNGLPFTVRAGKIYFVTATGSDSNDGSFTHALEDDPEGEEQPRGRRHRVPRRRRGRTVSQTTRGPDRVVPLRARNQHQDGASNSGTAAAPKALIAYPGARVTIGAESGLQRGLLTPAVAGRSTTGSSRSSRFAGETEAIDFEGAATGWRVVGNDISCPNGPGRAAASPRGTPSTPSNLEFFGNVVHDAAAEVASITKYYHGIYFARTTSTSAGTRCATERPAARSSFTIRTGRTSTTSSARQRDSRNGMRRHQLRDRRPSKGAVIAYNNVIYDVGTGPDPADGSSDYACIYVANTTNAGSAGSGNVQLFNNTFYNCGPAGRAHPPAWRRVRSGGDPDGRQPDRRA